MNLSQLLLPCSSWLIRTYSSCWPQSGTRGSLVSDRRTWSFRYNVEGRAGVVLWFTLGYQSYWVTGCAGAGGVPDRVPLPLLLNVLHPLSLVVRLADHEETFHQVHLQLLFILHIPLWVDAGHSCTDSPDPSCLNPKRIAVYYILV